MTARVPALALLAALALGPAGHGAPPPPAPAPADEITRLTRRIAAGEFTLAGSDEEILRAVLRELRIPVESQVLVFSRTSLQGALVRPSRPRALFFSDSVYVGWIPGGLIEVAAIDPVQGPIFYGFDPQDARERRRSFVRERSCLRCHGNGADNVPVLFTRCVVANDRGEVLGPRQPDHVDDTAPFSDRWGGWYVTGYTGSVAHRGNAFGRELAGRIDFSPGDRRPADLAAWFDATRYPASTSDLVALLVLQHQIAAHNAFARAARDVRLALPATLAAAAELVLDQLLFRGSPALPDGVEGTAAFRTAFAAGPRTPRGESLRDFSLRGQLFAHRCSFLIYSEAFAALPAPLHDLVLTHLAAVLAGRTSAERYAYLDSAERARLRDILRATLPAYARHDPP